MRINPHVALIAIGLAGFPALSMAQPMSAIDWLTDSVTEPVGPIGPRADISTGRSVEIIQVRPLDAPSIDGLGLIDPIDAGLPPDLWGSSDVPRLVRLIARERVDALPAIRELMMRLLLVRAAPPETAATEGQLYLARVDKLLELGALEEAGRLLEQGDLADPDVFRRWFDIRLLLGTEDIACDRLIASPDLAPTFPTRIFCLARDGDWDAAALSLDTAEALGMISDQDDAILLRFLDESNASENGALPRPDPVTPLAFRLYEAVGEAIPSDGLPRAFAHADLRPQNGWKAQLSAGERLAAVGAIPDDVLFDLYQQQKPAASGGVWDRAAAVQALKAAIMAGDDAGPALGDAWAAMQMVELEVPFARVFAPQLRGATLSTDGAAQAAKLAYLIGVKASDAAHPDLLFLDALAQGDPGAVRPRNGLERIVQQGFASIPLPENLDILLRENRIGEAILQATLLFSSGALGDSQDLVNALRLLRALGHEDTARAAATQLLILERRG